MAIGFQSSAISKSNSKSTYYWNQWVSNESFCSSHNLTKNEISILSKHYSGELTEKVHFNQTFWILYDHNILQETYQKFKDQKYQHVPFFARITNTSLTIEKRRIEDLFHWFSTDFVEVFYSVINFLESREGNSISTVWKLQRVKRTDVKKSSDLYDKLLVPWLLVTTLGCFALGPLSIILCVLLHVPDQYNGVPGILDGKAFWLSLSGAIFFETILLTLSVYLGWFLKKIKRTQREVWCYFELNKKKKSTFDLDNNNFMCAFFEVLTKEKSELKRILEKYKERDYDYDEEGLYLPTKK